MNDFILPYFKKQIFFLNTVYDPPPINVKITDSEINELIKDLYDKRILSRRVRSFVFFQNINKVRRIESYLVRIYKDYKKKPKEYNKFIELEKK